MRTERSDKARVRDWDVREATRDDLEAIRVLYRATWGYNRPEGFDRWRYLSPPEGLCPIALAVNGDRFVGAYTLWPTRLCIGNEVVLGAQSMDTMTHPEFQGQGIFTTLALACFEIASRRGFEVLYGFPNPLSYPGFVNRLNWDHTGDVWHWLRPIRPSLHRKVAPALRPVADGVSRLWPKGRKRHYDLVAGAAPNADLDPLLADWREQTKGCSIARDRKWLEWRYAPETDNGYEWVVAYDHGVLRAAGVWGMRGPTWGGAGDRRAHVTELLGADRRAREAVLAHIIERAHLRGAILIETITSIPSVITTLRGAGFVRHRRAPFIVRALTARNFGANIHDHRAWHVVGGDVDTF